MKTARTSHVEHESPWHYFWIALLTIMLALAMTIVAGAVHPRATSQYLWNEGVAAFRAGDFPAAESHLQQVTRGESQYAYEPALIDQGLLVWKALIAQARGDHSAAEHHWLRVDLPRHTAHWRPVALASIYLEQGMVDEAAAQLDEAALLAPDNSVVHYFTGLLRLEQAAVAEQWNDAEGPDDVRFAHYMQTNSVVYSRSKYLLDASQELENSLTAEAVDGEQPLVEFSDTVEPALRPKVSDLLIATAANDLATRANFLLSSVYLERGLLDLAEQRLDTAAEHGAAVISAYSELAVAFDRQGEFAAAGRAYLKAAEHGDAPITNLRKAWWSLRRSTWSE